MFTHLLYHARLWAVLCVTLVLHTGCGVLVQYLICSHGRVRSSCCAVVVTLSWPLTSAESLRVNVWLLLHCVLCVHREGLPGNVSHGEDRISPATPRNRNNDQPSRGLLQDAARTSRNQRKCHHNNLPKQTEYFYTQVNSKVHQVGNHTHNACAQGCARMYPVIKRPATQYLHSQTFTTRRGCEGSVMREAPRELTGGSGCERVAGEGEGEGRPQGGGFIAVMWHTCGALHINRPCALPFSPRSWRCQASVAFSV